MPWRSNYCATSAPRSPSTTHSLVLLRQQLAAINAELHLEPGNTDMHGTGDGQEDEDRLELLIRRVDTPHGRRNTAHCFLRGPPPQADLSKRRA